MESPHQFVREEAAGIVAELSQNNPYCQTHLVSFQTWLVDLTDQLDYLAKCLDAVQPSWRATTFLGRVIVFWITRSIETHNNYKWL